MAKPKLGVDLSHWQGSGGMAQGRWDALKSCGVRFAIMKATQGTSFVDDAFAVNLRRAKARGFEVGAYHFLQHGSPVAQARHFLQTVRQANGGTLKDILLVVDVERVPTKTTADDPRGPDVEGFLRHLAKEAPNRTRLVYTGIGYWGQIGNPKLAHLTHGLWLASWPGGPHYCKDPKLPDRAPLRQFGGWSKRPDIWQFGLLRYSGNRIDGNAFYGSMAELQALFRGKAPAGDDGAGKDGGGGGSGWFGGLDLEALLESLRNLIDDPLGMVDDVGGAIEDALKGTFKTVRNVLRSLVSAIKNTLGDLAKRAANVLAKQLRQVFDVVDDVVRGLRDGLERVIGKVTRGLRDLVDDVADTVRRQVGRILDGAAEAVRGMAETVSRLTDDVIGSVSDALSTVGAAVGAIIDDVTAGVGSLLDAAGSILAKLGSDTIATVADVLERSRAVLDDVAGRVNEHVEGVLRDIAPVVDAFAETVTGLPAALVDVASEIVDGIVPVLQDAGKDAAGFLNDPIGGILGAFFGQEAPELVDRIEGIIKRIEDNPKTPEDVKRLTRPGILPAIPLMGLVVAVAMPVIIGSLANTVLGPTLQVMVQEENRLMRPTLLGLADGINAVYRGERDQAWLLDVGSQLGYEDEDIRLALGTQRPLPNVGDVLTWRHRQLVSDAEARDELRAAGWTDERIGRYIEASVIIPPLSDLVRFAVREAFPGQDAYRETQAETPARFIDEAAKIGLPDTAARSYWAAHWVLPSVSQVFEMFQRGVIDAAELDRYLIVADVMPKWRERLTSISYTPFTRVDIRRMHALGLLDDRGVERAYRDIGYSPKDAKAQLAFVQALNNADEKAASAPERDLTRSDLTGAYRDGLLTREALVSALTTIGYDDDETALIVAREDLRVETAERRETKGLIVDAAVAGLIEYGEAQDRLAAAGLTTDEQALTLDTIERRREARLAAPTRADLFRFHKARIIDADELRAALGDLGYREPWLSRYIALAKTKLSPIEEAD